MSSEIIPYYVEVNVLTLTLLLIIHVNISKKTAYFNTEVLYRAAIVVTMIAIICDAVATGLEGAIYPGSVVVNYFLDIIYFLSSLGIPYLFMGYLYSMVHPDKSVFSRIPQIFMIPYYIYSALIVTSPITGLVFTISDQNVYSRGPLRPLHSVIAALVLAYAFAFTLYNYLKHKLPSEIGKNLLILPLFPLAGVIVRNLLQGSNIIWTAMTIGLLIIFINGQNSLIDVDPLTKLNNRGRCAEYLSFKLSTLMDGRKLYYTILDLNYFKQINDTFGHLEGDRALKIFAKALQISCADNKDFIARFGGDEFVIISERAMDENVYDVIEAIGQALCELDKSNSKYKISFSYGFAYTTTEKKLTDDELLIQADKEMYKCKQKFHDNTDSVIVDFRGAIA